MWPCLKLRKIEECLQSISAFEKPKILLEQYITPPHLASHILHTIQSQYGDINGKIIADLGCGSGVFSIGCAVLDAGFVVGFEIDEDAIDICCENIADMDICNVDVVQCDVTSLPSTFHKQFDTVIMNPPFGTKHNVGIDMKFLEAACHLSHNTIYSLHKTSTRPYVLKTTEKLGLQGEVLAKMNYNLSYSYKFHKKNSVDIEVDFFRFVVIK